MGTLFPFLKVNDRELSFLLRYALQSVAIILVLSFVLRTFVFSSYVMTGSGMLPSIWPGDFLVGWRPGLKHFDRGDVVAMRCPSNPETTCLKRVVGLPGDRVEFKDGRLLVNGQASNTQPVGADFARERLGKASWMIWPTPEDRKTTMPTIIPPNRVYVLNDKRSDTEDSRSFGPLDLKEIEAKAVLVWMSLDWYDGKKVRTWPRLRWSRVMRGID